MYIVRKRRRYTPILTIENLEIRNLLSAVMTTGLPVAIPEAGSNDTLDSAMDLGSSGSVAVDGTIDRDGVDVDWYSFTLLVSSEVTLNSTSGILGLYNSAGRDPLDKLNPNGFRLLAQFSSSDVDGAQVTRTLAAGTYYVAISGEGNAYFNPFLANSGLSGVSGDYSFMFTSTEIAAPVGSDPVPLAIDASALGVRVDFAENLGFSPTIELTDSKGNPIALAWTNFNSTTSELQFAPNQALAPGQYTAVIKDADGRVRMSLQVQLTTTTDEGLDTGNDTPATSVDLGEFDGAGFVQVSGTIGDDAYYDFSSVTPALRPGNDVDLYHFRVTSDTPIGLQAEVFAGRIGSTLDAGISLYRLDPATGKLQFVAGNNNTLNPTLSTNNQAPLLLDSVLTAGLNAGDYFIAVSSGFNTPAPLELQSAGKDSGIFDPEQSHSGSVGTSVGNYVLNLRTIEIADPPKVVSVSIPDQGKLSASPAQFAIQFSQFMNVSELALISNLSSLQNIIPGISIVDAKGNQYAPHLVSFDPQTLTAYFSMSERLASGSYQLRIDGTKGLSNIVGARLTGNDASGDYVVNFTVVTTPAGTAGNPTAWTHDQATDDTGSTQSLGVLFPSELKSGVSITRPTGNRSKDQADDYSFEILKSGRYFISLGGEKLPAGVGFQVLNEQGKVVASSTVEEGGIALIALPAGKYVLHVDGWSESSARTVSYRVDISALSINDNPPPLYSGPAPAIGIRLATATDPSGPVGPVPIGSGPGGIGSGGNGSGPAVEIPNVGLSTQVINTTQGPNDYKLNQGLPRLNTSSDLDSFVIAIPTVTSDGAGSRVQVARSLRRVGGLRDSLGTTRLSEFADGPVGRASSGDSDLTSTLSEVRKLSRLIDTAMISKKTEKNTQISQTPAPRNDAPVVADTEQAAGQPGDLDPEAVPAEGNLESGETEHTTQRTPEYSRLTSQIRNISNVVEGHNFEFQTANDSAFIPFAPTSDDDFSSESSALQSAYLPDTVFAAGMGLLVAHSAVTRQQPSGLMNNGEIHSTMPGIPSNRKKRLPR